MGLRTVGGCYSDRKGKKAWRHEENYKMGIERKEEEGIKKRTERLNYAQWV